MSETLEQALNDYYKRIKEKHANYRACYNSFLLYCNENFPNALLSDMSDALTMINIEHACKDYFEKSEKATSIEAIQRYLTAIDHFYRYIRERNIIWKHLENGCRKKQVIHDICISLNEELKQKIYLPFDEKEEVEVVEKELELLKDKNFYQLGQRVIYKLLITYGFKEKVIISMKKEALNRGRP